MRSRATCLFESETPKIEPGPFDATTLKAYGTYPGKTGTGVELKRCNSKDQRPDLKQLLFSLSVCADSAVPVHHKVYAGNRTDVVADRNPRLFAAEPLRGLYKFGFVLPPDMQCLRSAELLMVTKKQDCCGRGQGGVPSLRGKLLEASTAIVRIPAMRHDAFVVRIQRQRTAGLLQ
jgi:hypothetical protein